MEIAVDRVTFWPNNAPSKRRSLLRHIYNFHSDALHIVERYTPRSPETLNNLRRQKRNIKEEVSYMKANLTAIVGLGLLLAAAPAWAHHAFAAEFDSKKPVKLEGRVTKVEWINPHAWIHINVKNKDGSTTAW